MSTNTNSKSKEVGLARGRIGFPPAGNWEQEGFVCRRALVFNKKKSCRKNIFMKRERKGVELGFGVKGDKFYLANNKNYTTTAMDIRYRQRHPVCPSPTKSD